MSNNGKVVARERARALRAEAWTLAEIAVEVGAAKSSVSRWVRDVDFTPKARNRGHRSQAVHPLRERVQRETARFTAEGTEALGELSDQAFLAAGAALYVGEGFKSPGTVGMANTDPAVIAFFCRWLRTGFEPDEARLRGRVYLHEGLELEPVEAFWSDLTSIPVERFKRAHRALADPTRRKRRHEMGCFTVTLSDARLHRKVMGLCAGLLSSDTSFGGSSVGRAFDC